MGFAEDYVLPMLPSPLKRIRLAYPGIELSIVSAHSRTLCQQIEARSLDLALVTLPEAYPQASILATPALCWVAVDTFQLPEDQAWPEAFFAEGCVFRAAAIASLREKETPFRVALVGTSSQIFQSSVAAGTAITVMAASTVPGGSKELPPEAGLPELPKTCIQIIERNQGLSNAALRVKELVLNTNTLGYS